MSRNLYTLSKQLFEQQQKTNEHATSRNLRKLSELGFTIRSAVSALSSRSNAAVKKGLLQKKQCPVGVLKRLVK